MKGTRVLEGDILLNITGGSIGRSCIVPMPFVEANVNQHVCILRSENIREFISYAMKSSSTKEQIEACQVGGNREGLNFEQISKINICLPPEEEIGEF
jgi:type I restriction enzyme S subunit